MIRSSLFFKNKVVMTRIKDTSIIASGFTFQFIMENINLFLSVLAGAFTVIYAGVTAFYAILKLIDYMKTKKRKK